MIKIVIVFAAALFFSLTISSVASANGGPHGGYAPATDACAGCHRTHTAEGPQLLIATSTYGLCMTCHGSTTGGADTNVQDGYFLDSRSTSTNAITSTATNGYLLAGGFTMYKGTAATSSHDVSGSVTTAWGNGGANRGVVGSLALARGGLDCASCHDPHGSTNYRIMNNVVNSVTISMAQVDESVKDYDTEHWSTGQSDLCTACHATYHVTTAGSGSSASVATAGGYAHRIDMPYSYSFNNKTNVNPETIGIAAGGGTTYTLPLAGTDVVCQTCHLPHGTSATMSGLAAGGATGSGTLPGNTTATDSALLRLNNRAVCETCHQK